MIIDNSTHINASNYTDATGNDSDDYDGAGALRYIVVTLSVYALVGILSLLLVRIIRRAASRHRLHQEEDMLKVRTYIRNAHTITLHGHRQVLMHEKMKVMQALWNSRQAPAAFERQVSRPQRRTTVVYNRPANIPEENEHERTASELSEDYEHELLPFNSTDSGSCVLNGETVEAGSSL